MAGIVYELIEVLEEQKECYEGLITLATYTEHAIINKNISFLQEVVATQETFIGRLSQLDKKRESLMKDVSIVLGVPYTQMSVTKIIKGLGENSEVGQQLVDLRKDIKEQMTLLRRKNTLNKQLLMDSLELVNFMVNAIGSTKGCSHVGNYGRSHEGGIQVERQSHLFDQRQ